MTLLVSGPRDIFTAAAGPPDIVRLIEVCRLPLTDEKTLQAALAGELMTAGFGFDREVRLGDGDIVDFMMGDVAIEVKIKGGKREIFRQVQRYCRHSQVGALVLATRVMMGLPATVNGKPCFVASLGRAWL